MRWVGALEQGPQLVARGGAAGVLRTAADVPVRAGNAAGPGTGLWAASSRSGPLLSEPNGVLWWPGF